MRSLALSGVRHEQNRVHMSNNLTLKISGELARSRTSFTGVMSKKLNCLH